MILKKTPVGQQAFKERTIRLTPRQRSAFILFDGYRSVSEVLDAGVCPENGPYVVLEMLDGRPLDGILAARRRLSVAAASPSR